MKAQEFAAMAGVTVRALHHYDRLGLLRPGRSPAGYRIYRAGDLARLEQIVALQFLGLPLKQIRELLERDGCDLPSALRAQRAALEDKRRMLDRAIQAIAAAEGEPTPALLKSIIEAIEMQESTNWTDKYYSAEARAQFDIRMQQWTPELQEQCSKDWLGLIADCESALGEDPASERVQALAARWRKLVEGFTGGHAAVVDGLRKLYADQANWPSDFKEQMKPFMNSAVWELMRQARWFEK
jgi:MerR family transcriptional regulator, thiopeptide resistance regulator